MQTSRPLGKRPEKGDGFPGQRILVLPRPVVAGALGQPLTNGLLPTDAGFFPCAKGHRRERLEGAEQAIFIFCVKGSGWCRLAGQVQLVNAGDLLVIPPRLPHAYGAHKSAPWTIFWFHAQGALLMDCLRELETSAARPVIHVGDGPQLTALFQEMLDALEQGYNRTQLLCASQILAHLIAILVREHRQGSHVQSGVRQKIAPTVNYMKQHLDQPLTLAALAAIAHLSRSQYAELFKRQTGFAPVDYFIRQRMQRACHLLDTTDLLIKAIAAAVGYTDALYFSRLFKGINHMSPAQYRRLKKG